MLKELTRHKTSLLNYCDHRRHGGPRPLEVGHLAQPLLLGVLDTLEGLGLLVLGHLVRVEEGGELLQEDRVGVEHEAEGFPVRQGRQSGRRFWGGRKGLLRQWLLKLTKKYESNRNLV